MSEVVFITPEDAHYGFSLAGSRQLTIALGQAEARLCETLADQDVGVVVIDERLVKMIDEKRFAELETGWRGLLVTLPAPEPGRAEDALQSLIRRALGYHVRLQL